MVGIYLNTFNLGVLGFWGNAAFREFVREVFHKCVVGLHYGPECFHRQLIIRRNVDELDVLQLKQILFFGENLPEEVFIVHRVRRQVKLHCGIG